MDCQYSRGAKTAAETTLPHALKNRSIGCPDGLGGILRNSQTESAPLSINSTSSPAEDWAPTQNVQSAAAATATTIKMPSVHAAPARSQGSKHRVKTASRIPPAIANICAPSQLRSDLCNSSTIVRGLIDLSLIACLDESRRSCR
jgi:hypothetical protein